MMLVKASNATVERDRKDSKWHVHINVGAEVIKRPLPKTIPEDAGDDALREAAIATAKDEGYDVDTTKVSIIR